MEYLRSRADFCSVEYISPSSTVLYWREFHVSLNVVLLYYAVGMWVLCRVICLNYFCHKLEGVGTSQDRVL